MPPLCDQSGGAAAALHNRYAVICLRAFSSLSN
jgi:hypothetical protein